MRPFPAAVPLLAALLLIAACDAPEAPRDPDAGAPAAPAAVDLFEDYDPDYAAYPRTPPDEARAWAEGALEALTLDEKIGQLLIVDLPMLGRTRMRDEALLLARRHRVGGFLVRRLVGPRDVLRITRRLQEAAPLPLFFAADYERGVGRFDNALTELPSNMALGATADTALAAAAGRLTAIEARAVGVNLLFAPVVDVNNNPDNPIINIRSYGEDPEGVVALAGAFSRAAERAGLLTTLKHFPGHGNTTVDTHTELGKVESAGAALDSIELRPYRRLLTGPHAPAAVMTTHLWVPSYDPAPLPATFSARLLTGVLRDSLGFEGLVITDDIKMGAIRNDYSLAERTIRPLEAGADIILTPDDVPAAIAAIRQAVRSGRILEADINARVLRILTAKATLGLHEQRSPDGEALEYLLERPRGDAIAGAMAEASVTRLRGSGLLPLPDSGLALIHLTNYRGSESIGAATERLDAVLGTPHTIRIEGSPSERERRRALALAGEADVVVLALYQRLVAGSSGAGLTDAQRRLADEVARLGTPLVLVTFGNPYLVRDFPDAEGIVVAYDQSLATIDAVAAHLRGEAPAPGRLPVRAEPFEAGQGFDAPR